MKPKILEPASSDLVSAGDKWNAYKVLVGKKRKGKNSLEDLELDGR